MGTILQTESQLVDLQEFIMNGVYAAPKTDSALDQNISPFFSVSRDPDILKTPDVSGGSKIFVPFAA